MARKLRYAFAALISMTLFNGSVAAQTSQLTTVHADPDNSTFSISQSNGITFVVDGISRKIYLASAAGNLSEFSFDDALPYAEPDPSNHQNFLQALDANLANPLLAGYGAYLLPSDPDPVCWDSNECHVDGGGDVSILGADFDQDAELPKPLDLNPVIVTGMRPVIVSSFVGANYMTGYLGSYENPNNSAQYQQCYALDYAIFQSQQQAACAAMTSAGVTFVGATVLGLAACKGTAGLACAGSLLLIAAAWDNLARTDATCSQAYTAPANCPVN